MQGFEVSLSSFWIVAIMICVILLVIVAQISHISSRFKDYCKDNEANLIGLSGQIKKLQSTVSELLGENRRLIRIVNQLLELKQAEMTGGFEIVEEPLISTDNQGNEPAPEKTPEKAPELPKPAAKFPKIDLGGK